LTAHRAAAEGMAPGIGAPEPASMMSRMNEFSVRFVEALRHARDPIVRAMGAEAVGEHGAMRASGTTPGGHRYYVTTASGPEVTIGLGRHWHSHFDELLGDGEDEVPFAGVVGFLEALVREEMVIVEWYGDRGYAGSEARARGERSRELKGATRRVTVSWSGTHDGESVIK
jgi:hypothetical protein